jgi:colanic acid biosynthesis glycosyl transferase WcaI
MGAPAARVFELARHWVRSGHQVTILTGFPNHPTGKIPEEYRRKFWWLTCCEKIAGIKVIRTWLYPAPNRFPLERILNYTSFFASACIRGSVLSRPDVVIGTSPQLLSGLCGWWLSRLYRCPFVFEVRDLWPESLLASGIGRSGSTFIRTLDFISGFLYRHSEKIVVVTDAFKDNLIRKRGIAPAAIEVITNGVEPDVFYPDLDRDSTRSKLGLEGKHVVSYIGTIGMAHGLEALLNAAQRIEKITDEIVFLLIGEGAERARLQSLCNDMGLTNVRFTGQQPRDRIPALIAASDVCLVLLRNSELFKTVLPSKMFEFFSGARPVILGVDGEARRVLETADAGISVKPEDPDSLAEAVLYFDKHPDLRARYGQNGRRFVLQEYSRERKAADYIEVLKSLQLEQRYDRSA